MTPSADLTNALIKIGQILTKILNIELPFFGFTFGELLIGGIFFVLLIAVFRLIFASVNHPGGGGLD